MCTVVIAFFPSRLFFFAMDEQAREIEELQDYDLDESELRALDALARVIAPPPPPETVISEDEKFAEYLAQQQMTAEDVIRIQQAIETNNVLSNLALEEEQNDVSEDIELSPYGSLGLSRVIASGSRGGNDYARGEEDEDYRELLSTEMQELVIEPDESDCGCSSSGKIDEYAVANEAVFATYTGDLRTKISSEVARFMRMPHVRAFYVYPNTLGYVENSRPFSAMPKLVGYTAILSDECSILDVLSAARFEICSRVLLPIQPVYESVQQVQTNFRTWYANNPEARFLRHDLDKMIASVKELTHLSGGYSVKNEFQHLSFAHLINSPVEIQVVSRKTQAVGTDNIETEYFALVELLDTEGLNSLLRAAISSESYAWNNYSDLSQYFTRHEDLLKLAMKICQGLNLIYRPTSQDLEWDDHCSIVVENNQTIVSNHVLDWSHSQRHFYPVSTPGSKVRNLVAVAATKAPFRKDYQIQPFAVQRRLASVPFSRGGPERHLSQDVERELGNEASILSRIRDNTRLLASPYFPSDTEYDPVAAYVHDQVMQTTSLSVYFVKNILTPGRRASDINIHEAKELIPGGLVPFGNPYFDNLILEELAILLPSTSVRPTEKQRRIAAIFGLDFPASPVPFYRVAEVATSSALARLPDISI